MLKMMKRTEKIDNACIDLERRKAEVQGLVVTFVQKVL
jgi:hypothetical protein